MVIEFNPGKTFIYESDLDKKFDSTNPLWRSAPLFNLTYIQVQQRYANDLLNHRGHLFLNEVYDLLGIDRTPEGALVGWTKEAVEYSGVDFGIDQQDDGSFNLSFNVDGIIYNKI